MNVFFSFFYPSNSHSYRLMNSNYVRPNLLVLENPSFNNQRKNMFIRLNYTSLSYQVDISEDLMLLTYEKCCMLQCQKVSSVLVLFFGTVKPFVISQPFFFIIQSAGLESGINIYTNTKTSFFYFCFDDCIVSSIT